MRRVLTPELRRDLPNTELLLVDLGLGRNRLGGSALFQVFSRVGSSPGWNNPRTLSGFFAAIQELSSQGRLLAYHDRSDGGLFAALVEMAFASGTGLAIDLASLRGDARALLFNEELGAVLQVERKELAAVRAAFAGRGLGNDAVCSLGTLAAKGDRVTIPQWRAKLLFDWSRHCARGGSKTTHIMQRLARRRGAARIRRRELA